LASVKRLSKQVGNTHSFIGKVSIQDIDKALLKLSKQNVKSEEELKAAIPPEFHDLIALWKPKEAAKLHCAIFRFLQFRLRFIHAQRLR
jgi:hypothetical protein